MKNRGAIFGVALAVALSAAGPAFAEWLRPAEAAPRAAAQQDTGRLVMTKLFRGMVNAATGWMEIPKQMFQTSEQQGVGVGLSWGFVKGIGWAVGRSVIGAYEIATFPFPVPEEYRPVLQPEYVLSDLPESPQP